MEEIKPAPVRYIKLGQKGAWAQRSIERGEIHFGHKDEPHELALRGDRKAIIELALGRGHSASKASDFAREIMDFYQLGPETIWITFYDGYLWWAQAHPEVIWLGVEGDTGARMRRTLAPWSNKDRKGRPLRQDELSTKLTQLAAYRQTLCRVKPEEYLLRKLDGIEEPIVLAAKRARKGILTSASDLISTLHWGDFETLVDIILSRSGWHRVSMLGGTQKDVDLVVEQVVTGETAFVQVKSNAGQSTLDGCIAEFEGQALHTRMIFACHSARGALSVGDRKEIAIWDRGRLAEMAIKHGLFDWLVQRAA